MGLDVFGRIKDIVSANVDDLLSKAEDPEKMADQMVRKYEDAMKDLLGSTASIKAAAKESKQQLDNCEAEIKKYTTYAEKALMDHNEEKARQAIQLKQDKESLRATLETSYLTVKLQAEKAELDYRKLADGLEKTKARAQAMKNTVKAAKVRNLGEDAHSRSSNTAFSVQDKFEKLEAKASKMLNEAEAKEELLHQSGAAAELDALYGERADASIDKELQAMKEKMGL